MARQAEKPGYNGPDREKFLDTLADYEGYRFAVMQATSMAGKVMAEWERLGGDKQDLRDGFALRKLDPDEQKMDLRRQYRVAGWLGIVDEDAIGQRSFIKVFEQPTAVTAAGIGSAPLGSRLSLIRAKSAGYNDGKIKNGPTMQEGLEVYANSLGWEADSGEALSYAEGFGEGLPQRPAPKERKAKESDEAPDEGGSDEPLPNDPPPIGIGPAVPTGARRGRPRKVASAVDQMAQRAVAIDPDGAGQNASQKAGWDPSRDFYEELPPPIH